MKDKEIENWYHKWMSERGESGIATVNVLDMLKDFSVNVYANFFALLKRFNAHMEHDPEFEFAHLLSDEDFEKWYDENKEFLSKPNSQTDIPIIEAFLDKVMESDSGDVCEAARVVKDQLKNIYYRESQSGTVFTLK